MTPALAKRARKKPGASNAPAAVESSRPRRHGWGSIVEIGLIGIWALLVAHAYLNLDPNMIPVGTEFGQQTQTNHLWTQFQHCGWCALWNGSEQGGIPSLVDVHGSMLYPTVAVATLLAGVVNGVKISILLSLWLAGVGQWWIAKELKLGALARLYSAGIAVAGGHLAAKMDTANYQFIISTAAATLFIGGLVHLLAVGGRRAAVLLGILLAGFILSGQGYLQLGMIGLLPTALFLVAENRREHRRLWLDAVIALVVGVLLAAPLLVPFAHFAPLFGKEMDPGTFGAAQPLEYLPLNLVISDPVYLRTQTLGKLPWPWPYALFIGWIPLILAAFGLSNMSKTRSAAAWFFGSGTVVAFVLASGILPRAVAKYLPSTAASSLVDGLRFPSVIAALAIPLILGLSAWGLDHVWSAAVHWPKLALTAATSTRLQQWQLPLQWVLTIPLIYSLSSVYRFAAIWYQAQPQSDVVNQVVAALKTNHLEWVSPPFGIFAFIEPAVGAGLKLSPGFLDVRWKGAQIPPPVLIATSGDAPQNASGQLSTVGGVTIYRVPGEYAAVNSPAGEEACTATGSGGQIAVTCETSEAGQLTVQENQWSGWRAWIDGKPVALLGDDWLAVQAPAGHHVFEFRYLPWDVPLGLALCILGIGLSLWLWWRPLPFLVA